jgi:hypothetical protein
MMMCDKKGKGEKSREGRPYKIKGRKEKIRKEKNRKGE